jgi:long-chain fatty acid transport protein
MKLNKILVSLFAAGIVATPLAHATNGYFPIAYGAKNEAMGGASIALPLDSIAAANNPAGMVMVGDRIDFQLTWFKPDRSAEIANSGGLPNGTYDGNGRSNFFIPDFGYNKMINADTSIGVSVFGNGGMNTQYNNNPFGGFPGGGGNLGINLSQLFVAPTWAMKINPTNSVGVAVNLAYQMFSATGLGAFDNAFYTSNPGYMTDKGTDTSTGYGLRVGWTGEITPDVTLGATYQTKTKMGKFSNYSGLFAEQGGFDIPSKYGIGIAVKAQPETTIAFDIERINYQDVPSVGSPFIGLQNGSPPGTLFGADNGPGFGWQNINVYKFGVSHAYNQNFTLRAGYDHCDQPIPQSQTLLNIMAPGVVQDHLSLGGTWTLADKSEITVAYVHAFKKTVNGSGSVPTTGGGGGGFGGGEMNLTMSEDSIGIAYGW